MISSHQYRPAVWLDNRRKEIEAITEKHREKLSLGAAAFELSVLTYALFTNAFPGLAPPRPPDVTAYLSVSSGAWTTPPSSGHLWAGQPRSGAWTTPPSIGHLWAGQPRCISLQAYLIITAGGKPFWHSRSVNQSPLGQKTRLENLTLRFFCTHVFCTCVYLHPRWGQLLQDSVSKKCSWIGTIIYSTYYVWKQDWRETSFS